MFLYIFSAGKKLNKVGISKNVERRLQSLNHGSPIDILFAFKLPMDSETDARYLERQVLSHLKNRKVRGEWLSATVEEIKETIHMLSMPGPNAKFAALTLGAREYQKKYVASLIKTPEDACRFAVSLLGGLRPVADLLGISSQAVQSWKRCPATRVLPVEKALRRKTSTLHVQITRFDLRPDIYGVPK